MSTNDFNVQDFNMHKEALTGAHKLSLREIYILNFYVAKYSLKCISLFMSLLLCDTRAK